MNLMTIRLQIICWYFYLSRYHVLYRYGGKATPGEMEDRFPERYPERRVDDIHTNKLLIVEHGGRTTGLKGTPFPGTVFRTTI